MPQGWDDSTLKADKTFSKFKQKNKNKQYHLLDSE